MVQMNAIIFYRIHKGIKALPASLILVIFMLAGLPAEDTSAAPDSYAISMTDADRAYLNLDYSRADSLYTSMIETDPKNPDIFWKMSRLYVSIAEAMNPKDLKRRLPYYARAVDFARTCITLDSTCAAGHTWLAASLGVMADRIGAKEKINRANEIKRELDRAIALNPNDDVAWSILGSFYRETSQIGWFQRFLGNTFAGAVPKGSKQEAEQAFKKAISLNPRAIRHYHELALLYIEERRNKEAMQMLQTALTKPVLMKSDIRRIEDIRALIRQLSGS